MPGTLSQADLVVDLKASLHDAAEVFVADADGDFIRHLDRAVADLTRFRPRTLVGTVTLVAGESLYDPPAGLLSPALVLWGNSQRRNNQPWEKGFPNQPPTLSLVESEGVRKIQLSPAPTASEIHKLGTTFEFTYSARHQVGVDAADTTIDPADRDLLLLRAQAEAMLEMSVRNSGKSATQAPGGGQAKNTNPMAIHGTLMERFERWAAR
ncbi:MAG: hypothetical protein HQL72_02320 [Magnetococcales bacterium]|nr:hypothetical protein [Magnetococcales bacterium]